MTAPQGTFTFPGIVGVISASTTFSLGIAPSVTSVTIPPNMSLTQLGTAAWHYGGTTIRSLPNSVVDEIRISRAGGATTWIVSILDRRWAWEYGEISGEYNVLFNDTIIASTEKTPRQLAQLCLDTMGETGYDVSAVPADDRPYINWELETPAKALSDLLGLYGLTVTLRLDNTVAVVQIGTGAAMPAGALVVEESIQPAAVPSKLKVVTAPVQWQVDFETDAVGAEQSGNILEIDDLSYAPAEGWALKDPIDFEFITDKANNRLAKDTVRKWYWIALPETPGETEEDPPIGLVLPDNPVEIESLRQILPILDESMGTKGSDDNQTQNRAIAWGKYFDGHTLGSTNTTDAITKDGYGEDLHIEQSYSVNTETGVVQFSEPCILMDSDPTKRTGTASGSLKGTAPAQVFLRCFINVRDKDTRAPQRVFKEIDVDPTSPAPPKFVVREDIVPQYWQDSSGNWQDNLTDVEAQLDFYIAQEVANFQTFPGSTGDYAGFVQIIPDGALRQIAYAIDASGQATTKITRNIERFDMSLSFKESRKRQSLAVAREKAERERLKRPKKKTPRNGGSE
jgi:hypothetical protein